MTQDTLMWKLFPYFLITKAEIWYTYNIGTVNNSWDELKDNFSLKFFQASRVNTLHRDIRLFRQNEKESVTSQLK